MKKERFLLPLLLLFAVTLQAQNYQWAKRLAGTGAFDVQVNDVIVDQNVYVGGSFSGTVDFDPGTGVSNRTANGTDGFIAKYDHGGNLIWVYSTNATGNQEVRGLNLSTKLNATVQTSNSSMSLIALETANAAVYASTSFSTSSAIKVNKMAKNSQTVLYVVGSFSGNFMMSGGISAVGTDAFLMSFTLGSTPTTYFSLNFLKGYGGNGYQEAFDASVRLPVVRMAGVFDGTCTFPSGGSVSLTSAGGTDGFVIDLNSLGDPGSANRLRIGAAGNDGVTSIESDPGTRAFAIGGYFSDSIDFDPSANTVVLKSSGLKDGFVARYGFGTSGVYFSFAKRVGGTFDDEVTDVSVSTNGAHPVYYAVSNGAASGTAISTGAYDSLGTVVTFGGLLFPANQTTLNRCNSICTYNPSAGANPDVYLGGIFNARTDFNPGTGVDTIPAISGGNNGFIQKFSSCGTATQPTIAATKDSVCVGLNDTLSITSGALNGSANWIWYSGSCGGTQIGSGSSIVVNPTATTNYYARGEGGCASTSGVCSNVKQVQTIQQQIPVLTISTAQTSVCSGTSVPFSSSTTYSGTNTAYVWQKNNQTISGATSANYTASSIQNGDVFRAIISTTNNCGVLVRDTSNPVTITITQNVATTATISAPASSVCQFGTILFSASTNASSPTYQWLRDGVSIFGATSATYNANAAILGAAVSISCLVTTNQTCFTPNTATSNSLTITVTPAVTPDVSIVASATTVCPNGGIQFTATPTNGGPSPTYTWTKNGTSVQSGSSDAYVSVGFVTGDVVRCLLTSNATCPSPAVDSSNKITVTVSPPAPYIISLSASQTSICSGNSVTFTSSTNYACPNINYQWFKNGVQISGAGQSTYSTSSIANNDQFTVRINTTNAVCGGQCLSNSIDTSNVIAITVSGSSVVPSISIATPSTTICTGASITFNATASNQGTAPTYQWKKNGNNITGATSATYTTSSVANNDIFTCVLTSSLACASPTTATSNSITITVTPTVTPSVTISTTNTTVCAGSNVTFTATPVNGGASPTYIWKRNGNVQASTTATYTSNTLVNNDVITCELTSNAQCASPTTANSNSITITISPLVNAGISIAATQTTICSGNSVTFTATPVNGGNAPVYQWRKNGASISGATAATYTTSTLANGDVFACNITSNAACLGNSGASSNTITISVSNSVTPAISISTPNTSVCAGANVTFTATPTNGGSSPTYQWKKNGVNISGATFATYIVSNLANNDAISCVLTSSVSCASPATATSNTLTITVSPTVAPSVTIATPNSTICAGSSITFTATPVNGGANPTYTWRENGVDQGNTTSTYTVPNIANGTVVNCVLLSSANCASPVNEVSNSITVTVTPLITPAVSITASQTTICAGGSVTLTATPTNGGSTPAYQWKKNGSNISGATSATYTASGIANGDVFTCQLTSNAACLATNNVTSNSIAITISGSVTPAISISTPAITVCAGTNVTFTASPTNGGTTPTYQWKKNGVNISGATSTTYTTSSIANNDIFTCVLTSSVACASPTTATSNSLSIAVNSNVTPAISISTSNTTVCAGSSITVVATAVNGGNAPQYTWIENGFAQGETSNTYTTSGLQANATISCALLSNAACASTTSATSNTLNITVTPLVAPTVSITATQTTVCAGNSITLTATPVNGGTQPTYQWKKNGNNINGATSSTYTTGNIADGDIFTCSLTSNATCISTNTATSNALTINVSSSVTPALSISTANTTICTGASATFTATPTNGGATPAYQWKKNNANIAGATGATYTSSTLTSGDVISCVLTSSVSCASPTSATSNSVTVTVSPAFTPAVTITATDDTICELSSVTFTAAGNGTVSNYQWTVNSANANPGNSIAFTPASITNGDTVRCIITSSQACASPAQATSAPFIVTVLPAATVEVSIETGQDTTCAGSAVSFTATPTNGGDNPVYEWSVNGNEISGSTGSNFTSLTLSDADVVACILTSSSNCVANSQATSNSITISIVNSLTASVSITANQPSVCQGSLATFTATGINGGIAANYTWSVNGIDVLTGSGGPQIALNNLNNSDTVRCRLTSSESCVTQAVVTSAPVVVTVNALPNVTVNASGNVITVPTAASYQWIDCNGNTAISGATSVSYTATINGDYKVAVTNAAGCADTSACVNVNTVGVEDAEQEIIIIWPNPFTAGVTVSASEFSNGFTMNVYNTLGALVKRANSLTATYSLPLNDLTNGIYFIKVSNGTKTFVKRIEKL